MFNCSRTTVERVLDILSEVPLFALPYAAHAELKRQKSGKELNAFYLIYISACMHSCTHISNIKYETIRRTSIESMKANDYNESKHSHNTC